MSKQVHHVRVDEQVYTRLLAMKHRLEVKHQRFVPIGEAVKELLKRHDNHQKED
jgi:hypothetical protein